MFSGYGSGYYLIESRDFYHIKTGQLVETLSREDVDTIRVYPGFLQIEDFNDKVAVYDEQLQKLGEADKVFYV